MKFLLMLLFTVNSQAAEVETTFGGLSYHLFNPDNVSERFSNKISNNGQLIYTGLMGVGYHNDHTTLRVFIGQNSIADTIYGATYSYNWDWGILRYGPIVGFYQQNDERFADRGIKPYSIGYGIVPIVGGEFSIRLLTIENQYVRLNTIVTPVMINETIGWGIEL